MAPGIASTGISNIGYVNFTLLEYFSRGSYEIVRFKTLVAMMLSQISIKQLSITLRYVTQAVGRARPLPRAGLASLK